MHIWVKKLVEKLKKEYPTGIEVKTSGNSHYVYKSTTYWVKETKKRRKKSTYLGKLDKEKGFIKSTGKVLVNFAPRTVKTYGTVALIHAIAPELPHLLKEIFPGCWQELYSMALVRLLHQAPMKRVASVWESLSNQLNLTPNLSPKQVSSVFRQIGANRDAQNKFFKKLMESGSVFAYDLSFIFSRSEGINFAERGYNRFHLNVPQINLVLLSSISDQVPNAIRVVPGSVRDISTLYVTIEELSLESKILILDRGFFAEELMKNLEKKGTKYVIPAKRNSSLYQEVITLESHFFYNERLIKCGMKKMEGFYIFLFEDTMLKMEEERNFYQKIDKNQKKKEDMPANKFGKILIVSNLDKIPEEIFLLYKQRDEVEQAFDTFKNLLEADKAYLQDNETLFGHIFVSFIALYLQGKIRVKLKSANLLKKYSVDDILWEFGKIYSISDGSRLLITEIPKKLRGFDEAFRTNLFPKLRS